MNTALPADAWSARSREVAALLARTALADRAAFARLYDATSAQLFAVVLRIQRDRELAEDLLQEIYVNVWRSAASFDASRSQPLTWLVSIARNRAIDSLRRAQAQPPLQSISRDADDEDEPDAARADRRVWRRIEQRLWPTVAALPRWQRVSPWRGLATLASAATLGLAVLLALPGPAQPPVVVVLQGTAGTAQGVNSFVASISGAGRVLVTRPLLPVSLEPGRMLELWSVPPDGAPRSLGLISAAGATVVSRDKLPATLLRGGTAALAVSLEPRGGSPTSVPTGPVLYTGRLQL